MEKTMPSTSAAESPNQEINKLKDQLEQQALQTRQALAQLMLVREQLISETNARIEAQVILPPCLLLRSTINTNSGTSLASQSVQPTALHQLLFR